MFSDLSVTYMTSIEHLTNTTIYDLTGDVSKASFCGENESLIIDNLFPEWTLTLDFTKNYDLNSSFFHLDYVRLDYSLNSSVFAGAKYVGNKISVNHNIDRFQMPCGSIFSSDYQELNLTVDDASKPAISSLQLFLRNFQLEAFIR